MKSGTEGHIHYKNISVKFRVLSLMVYRKNSPSLFQLEVIIFMKVISVDPSIHWKPPNEHHPIVPANNEDAWSDGWMYGWMQQVGTQKRNSSVHRRKVNTAAFGPATLCYVHTYKQTYPVSQQHKKTNSNITTIRTTTKNELQTNKPG